MNLSMHFSWYTCARIALGTYLAGKFLDLRICICSILEGNTKLFFKVDTGIYIFTDIVQHLSIVNFNFYFLSYGYKMVF